MDKVFYYVRITKISIIKALYKLDNEELFQLSSSSTVKVWSSSDSDTKEEENIDTDDPESIDSEMLEILSSIVFNLWQKIQIDINTDFTVNGWMLYAIPHIHKDSKYHSDSDHRRHANNVIKTFFHGVPEDRMAVTQDIF